MTSPVPKRECHSGRNRVLQSCGIALAAAVLLTVTASGETPAERLKRATDELKKTVEDTNEMLDDERNTCLGGAFGDTPTVDQMIAACNSLIRKRPHYSWLHYDRRGQAYYEHGDYDRAIADFNVVMNDTHSFSRPATPWFANVALQERGLTFLKKGDHNRAIADFDATLQFFSQNPDPNKRFYQVAVSYGGRADAYRAKRDNAAATRDYRKAIELMSEPIPAPEDGGCYPSPFLWRNIGCIGEPVRNAMLAWLNSGLDVAAAQASSRPDPPPVPPTAEATDAPSVSERAGLHVADMSPLWRLRFKIDESVNGVVVTGVDTQSAAAEKGLRSGDVIGEVGQQKVANADDLRAVLSGLRRDGKRMAVLLVRNRDGGQRYIAMPLP